MSRPSPREVFDDPVAHWAFLTQSTDDDFEGQHFDRKEAGRLDAEGTVSRRSLDGVRDLVRKTLSAFGNSNKEGGLLVLGISSTGDVMGIDHLSETQQNDLCDQNTSLLHLAADVRLFDCKNANGDDKTICVMLNGWATTGICETTGNSPKAWTRNGAQCVTVTQPVRDSLRIRKGLIDVEINPFCEYDPDDVDKDVLTEFRKVFQPGASAEFDDERLLKEAGAIVKKNGDFWFTMPGVLFFSSNPQRMLAHAYIRLMRFGVVSADFRNRGTPTLNREFKGPVTSQIRAARTYLRDSGFFKRFQKRNPDGGFIEEPELPPVAIDEAIVNAVAHRDYCTRLPTECEAYLDAFIVKNPGRVIQRNIDLPDHFRLDTTHLDSTPRNGKLLPITVKYASNIAYLTAAFLRQREPFTLHPALESTPWFI
jgi:predicted HTH transcriptional regulator